jgi:hypothetical protein
MPEAAQTSALVQCARNWGQRTILLVTDSSRGSLPSFFKSANGPLTPKLGVVSCVLRCLVGLLQGIRWSFEELGEAILVDGFLVRFFR